MIENERKLFQEVTAAISSVDNVCLTADMWSTTHRSLIGMTAHWLDEKTFIRKPAVLCCKKTQGQQLNFAFENFKKTNIFEIRKPQHDLISGLIEKQILQK